MTQKDAHIAPLIRSALLASTIALTFDQLSYPEQVRHTLTFKRMGDEVFEHFLWQLSKNLGKNECTVENRARPSKN